MDKDTSQIKIPLSRFKMILLLLFTLSLTTLGLFLIFFEPESINYSSRHSWIMRPFPRFLTGVVFVVFFGFALIIMVIRLFNKNPGLIINEKGIYDNSTAVALGFIPWKDIKDIKIVNINNGTFILIVLRNPIAYINKTTQWLKLRGLKMNYRFHGTPISISANSLQIEVTILYNLLIEKRKEYKK
ncbi:STM3941 family protein [Chryseobacterium sp.]|uniref:STM3941 family protein n=1 Tax=Chryseobacterium sp. TaxID=1871047 RepID=UPI002FCC7A61